MVLLLRCYIVSINIIPQQDGDVKNVTFKSTSPSLFFFLKIMFSCSKVVQKEEKIIKKIFFLCLNVIEKNEETNIETKIMKNIK